MNNEEDTQRHNSIPSSPPLPTLPSPPNGDISGAPEWFRAAIDELKNERIEMRAFFKETLDEMKSRDERMLTMLQKTIDRSLENDQRLTELETRLEKVEAKLVLR